MNFRRRRRSAPVITIVSLIDILTILLIFCIVTTTFKTQDQAVQITLPESKAAVEKTAETHPAILAVAKDGAVYLEGKAIAMEEVGSSVKKLQDDKRPVGLKVDEEAPVKKMFEVLDSLKLAGVQSLPAFTREKTR